MYGKATIKMLSLVIHLYRFHVHINHVSDRYMFMYNHVYMYIIFPAMIANSIACIHYAKENMLLSL